jgi:hypothetical protein
MKTGSRSNPNGKTPAPLTPDRDLADLLAEGAGRGTLLQSR